MKNLLLELKEVGVVRDGKKLLQDVSFSLNAMETLSIIGAKGAGKGLLFKTLLGIQKGEVSGLVRRHFEGRMGLVSKTYSCIETFTVFQNLSLVTQFAGVYSQTHLAEEIEEVLRMVDLWQELKPQLHKNVESLTGFQKARLELARTLLLKPRILLLDKPTLEFDPEKKARYEAIVDELKQTASIIWLNHDLEQAARVSDKILYLKEGRMVEFGSAENVFTMPISTETEDFISRRAYASS